YKESYDELFAKGEQQRQLSKEFVREWLIENNFQGKEGQTMPEMSDMFVNQVSERYIELYESITGSKFERADITSVLSRVEKNILKFLTAYYR
ncbi:MAG TPA: phosphoribosylaminoimidazolesuccinocarboxamide synthase, partial [Bacteroidales bacterium]|nr:phosphoribosylaminoimidazolesuccinocarboxamide synthase [Bacteroidales bacterium]